MDILNNIDWEYFWMGFGIMLLWILITNKKED